MIASSTRGFVLPQADTPPVISPYAGPPQDQDEKGSLSTDVSSCWFVPCNAPEPGLDLVKPSRTPVAQTGGQQRRGRLAALMRPYYSEVPVGIIVEIQAILLAVLSAVMSSSIATPLLLTSAHATSASGVG